MVCLQYLLNNYLKTKINTTYKRNIENYPKKLDFLYIKISKLIFLEDPPTFS